MKCISYKIGVAFLSFPGKWTAFEIIKVHLRRDRKRTQVSDDVISRAPCRRRASKKDNFMQTILVLEVGASLQRRRAQYGARNMSTLEVFVDATFSYVRLSNKRNLVLLSFDMRLL